MEESTALTKPSILYIDDVQDNLLSFKSVFRREYQIDTVSSAQEALTLIDQNLYELIISDQRMPGMTGVEFFGTIVNTHPDPMRIILTGYSDFDAIVEAINKGKIYYYVSKPWDPNTFKIIIDKAVESYRLKSKNKDLQQANLMAQFEVLKNQINPHFLFNSLNVLKSLVKKDPVRAEEFINYFSRIYRIVLDIKDTKLIPLAEELELVRKYKHLQKIRFDEALEIDLRVSDKLDKYLLPPFSLQLSIENCIKHNIVTSDSPLHIQIEINKDCLEVKNNKQLRIKKPSSSQIGVKNIVDRYRLLKMPLPEILDAEDQYVIRLPLIRTMT